MRFEFAYDKVWGPFLKLLGLGPGHAWIEVEAGLFQVRAGWEFRLDAPVAAVATAVELEQPIPLLLGVGVHGWNRRWAVNGARRPHVEVRFAAPQRGRTLGFPIWVETLHLSPADPAGLIGALQA